MKGEWEPFFKEHGEYVVRVNFYECDGLFTVEELYQAIKERLKDELMCDLLCNVPNATKAYGLLIERPMEVSAND